MPRIPRSYLPEQGYFHIILRGNNLSVFRDNDDYEEFIGRLARFKSVWPFLLHHYVPMGTHAHFVVYSELMLYISKAFQALQVSYAAYFNKKYKNKGHIWHTPFRTIPIEDEAYLLECGRYVETNPTTARIVADPSDYRWSSYHHYTGRAKDSLVDENPLFEGFGSSYEERWVSYERFINERVGSDCDEDRERFEDVKIIGDPPKYSRRRGLLGRNCGR